MKKKLHPTSQFKKDFKRIQKFPQKIATFEYIANLLINDQPIPQEYKPRMLKGEYKGCMECHDRRGFSSYMD
ncbi:type II toxin-antitoxin system YafQ family toxin [Parabacteroides hominis]|uniref:type II toxin-antitoxin system YafQ family toxin n=1 Tax=Parabacteroides hominis TaxID=2763057 RepID=UPI0026029AEE|nr:type II toxin-antitoxin system YafQ family toxin [uncultured Parabacteroides sp.]